MRDYTIQLQKAAEPAEHDRLTLPNSQRSVKQYGRFFGPIAHFFNFAIKATHGENVWYINAKSFAKSCTNPEAITNTALRTFVENKRAATVSSTTILNTPVNPPQPCQLKGPLGKEFKWPSDHLPIGGKITLEGGTKMRFVSYNVLNQAYLQHITNKNDQGLNGSDITAQNQSKREARICEQIVEMIRAGNDVIALQECSVSLMNKIQRALPPGYSMSVPNPPNNEGPCIYNSAKYSVTLTHKAPYPVRNKYINTFELTVKDTGEKLQLVNTHVQLGNEAVLANHLAKEQGTDHILLVGDMNSTPETITKAFGNKFQHSSISGNAATHINTKKQLTSYDQVHLITPKGKNQLTATAHQDPATLFGTHSKARKDLENVYRTVERFTLS